METTQYQMGWNDVLGNVRRATEATPDQKDDFCRKIIKAQISFASRHADYIKGACAAAQAILDRQAMTYKGPQHVIDDMIAKAG